MKLLSLLFSFLPILLTAQIHLFNYPPRGNSIDTFYYPYYNGVQMIEIDNVGAWEAEVAWHEMTQPRALSWNMLIPGPGLNVYLFRDNTGKIIKAFNTNETPEHLTKAFRKIPLNRESNNPVHQLTGGFHTGKYHQELYSYHSRQLEFNGLYKVYDMTQHQVSNPGFTYYHIGKVGLIDSLGNFFLPIEYDNIIPAGNKIVTAKDGISVLMDRNKKNVAGEQYNNCDESYQDDFIFYKEGKICAIYKPRTDKLFRVDHFDWIDFDNMHYVINNRSSWKHPALFKYGKDGKFGFINEEFIPVSPPVYDKIYWFNENRAMVCRDGKFGFIDSTVTEVIPCRFDYAEFFRNGMTVVIEDNKEKCLDKNGIEIKEGCRKKTEWRNITGTYVIGMTIVRTDAGSGVINEKQQFVVPPLYEQIRPVRLNSYSYKSDTIGYFDVTSNKKHGLIDSKGKIILPCEYDEFSEYPNDRGFRAVKKNGKWGVVNSQWLMIIPCVYDEVSVYSGQNRFFIAKYDGAGYPQKRSVGITDTSGKIIVPPTYGSINSFRNGWALVQNDSLFGFIDSLGSVVIPIKFERLNSEFHNGLCVAWQNGKAGFINEEGEIVIQCIYDEARVFTGEATGVQRGDRWALIDRNGKQITDFIYEYISYEWYRDGEVAVRKNGKLGFINAKGKEVIPCIYDNRWGYSPDKGHHLEKDGERVWVKAK